MDGASEEFGAVAYVREVKLCCTRFIRPCPTNMFASQSGLEMVPNADFTTSAGNPHWDTQMANMSQDLETVGAVALDIHGALAAAGSTG